MHYALLEHIVINESNNLFYVSSYSPSQSAAEDESSTSQPTPTKLLNPVIGKELAKKRLRAFQLSKQANLSASTSKSSTRPDTVTETTLDDDSPSTTSSTAPSDEIKKKKTKGAFLVKFCVG